MKRTILVMALAFICAAPSMAQDKAGRGNRDPKQMSAMVAKKLKFNDDQMEKLDELNKKYPGSDFDKMKYREEFRTIMTEEQKKEMAELKAKREGAKGNRHMRSQ
jgi:Spy/CpxP family protein refolding chaperone